MNQKWMLTGLTLAALAAGTGCNSDAEKSEEFGSMDLALSLDGGLVVSSVDVTISGEGDSTVSRAFSLDVSDANATVSAAERGLPEGDYTVELKASVEDDPSTGFDESTVACTGSVEGIAVAAGETADANLTLTCTLDGGLAQTAGAIRIQAETELEVINNCPDLGTSTVGPLDATVGESVALAAQVANGVGDVSVTWTASHGTLSEDGTSYTCPDVAGDFDLTVNFERADGCSQEWTEKVACHTAYDGPVVTLPTAFAVGGSCGGATPCHLEQDGKAWQAVCGERPDRLSFLSGEADDENSFSFYNGQTLCQGFVLDGELVAVCKDDEGSACEFVTNSNPAPDAFCPQLASASNVQVCSGTYDECSVAQDRCSVLIKCGDTYLGRDLNADGMVRLRDRHEGLNYYCTEPTVDGVAEGTCEQITRSSDKATCDYSAEYSYVESACEETMTEEGFVLEGCGFEGDYCVGVQNGCGWRLVCASGYYGGVTNEDGVFEFTGPNGAACSGSVDAAGNFVGGCDNECNFQPRAAEAPGDCMLLPENVIVSGCANANSPYQLIQDGCKVGGVSPVIGEAFSAQVTDTSVTWVANGNYNCEVSPSETGVLSGACSPASGQGPTCSITISDTSAN